MTCMLWVAACRSIHGSHDCCYTLIVQGPGGGSNKPTPRVSLEPAAGHPLPLSLPTMSSEDLYDGTPPIKSAKELEEGIAEPRPDVHKAIQGYRLALQPARSLPPYQFLKPSSNSEHAGLARRMQTVVQPSTLVATPARAALPSHNRGIGFIARDWIYCVSALGHPVPVSKGLNLLNSELQMGLEQARFGRNRSPPLASRLLPCHVTRKEATSSGGPVHSCLPDPCARHALARKEASYSIASLGCLALATHAASIPPAVQHQGRHLRFDARG